VNDKNLSRLLLLSAIPAILLMAFLFDFATLTIQQRNSEGAGMEPILVVLFPIFELVVVMGVMALFWFLMRSEESNRLVVILMGLIGLLVLYATPIMFFLPVPMTWFSALDFISPGTFLFQAGAMMGGAALLTIILKKEKPDTEPEEQPASLSSSEQ
jgi:hypothetical protein